MASRFARISGGAAPMQRVGRAVNAASRIVPKTTCLTQALATQVLLGRPGQSSRLRIGVIRDEQGQFEAHAWVECAGEAVIGGPAVDYYMPLLALERDR